MNTLIPQFISVTIFLSIFVMHMSRKNSNVIFSYAVQSLAIVSLMLLSYFQTRNAYLFIVAVFVFFIKVVLAPRFLERLTSKHNLVFSVGRYMSMTPTLIIFCVLTAMAHTDKFLPLASIVPSNQAGLSLALSSIFLSLFFVVNNKGALSQIIGILSLENSIVLFAMLAGLEQSMELQIGIIFEIFVWLMIATSFVSMIHKHFGSVDVTAMKHLRD